MCYCGLLVLSGAFKGSVQLEKDCRYGSSSSTGLGGKGQVIKMPRCSKRLAASAFIVWQKQRTTYRDHLVSLEVSVERIKSSTWTLHDRQCLSLTDR